MWWQHNKYNKSLKAWLTDKEMMMILRYLFMPQQ